MDKELELEHWEGEKMVNNHEHMCKLIIIQKMKLKPLPENDISRENKLKFAPNQVRASLSFLPFPHEPLL